MGFNSAFKALITVFPKISSLDPRLNRINRLTNSHRILYKFSYFALYARLFKALQLLHISNFSYACISDRERQAEAGKFC